MSQFQVNAILPTSLETQVRHRAGKTIPSFSCSSDIVPSDGLITVKSNTRERNTNTAFSEHVRSPKSTKGIFKRQTMRLRIEVHAVNLRRDGLQTLQSNSQLRKTRVEALKLATTLRKDKLQVLETASSSTELAVADLPADRENLSVSHGQKLCSDRSLSLVVVNCLCHDFNNRYLCHISGIMEPCLLALWRRSGFYDLPRLFFAYKNSRFPPQTSLVLQYVSQKAILYLGPKVVADIERLWKLRATFTTLHVRGDSICMMPEKSQALQWVKDCAPKKDQLWMWRLVGQATWPSS